VLGNSRKFRKNNRLKYENFFLMLRKSNIEEEKGSIWYSWAAYESFILILILTLIEVYFLSVVIDQLLG
jgi:hypothetical protein